MYHQAFEESLEIKEIKEIKKFKNLKTKPHRNQRQCREQKMTSKKYYYQRNDIQYWIQKTRAQVKMIAKI